MKQHTLSRLFRGFAVAASLAVLAAPAALARTDAYGPHDSWYSYAVSQPQYGPHDPWYSYAVSQPQARDTGSFTTDTLAPGGGSSQVQGYRLITDTLAPGGGTIVSAPAARGFDWGAAGIGAAITVGLLLLLLGSTRVVVHRRRVVAA